MSTPFCSTTTDRARTTTTLTVENTAPFDPVGQRNVEAALYAVLYGPRGATAIDWRGSAPLVVGEEPIDGHPGVGHLLHARPLASDSITVAWAAPAVLHRAGDGGWEYQLHVRRVVGGDDDVVHLDVHLPPGWTWLDQAPPSELTLDADFTGAWRIVPSRLDH